MIIIGIQCIVQFYKKVHADFFIKFATSTKYQYKKLEDYQYTKD